MVPTELYLVWRIVERFQSWVRSPAEFRSLPEDTQAQLMAYEQIREAEEIERAAMMAGISLLKK